MTYRKQLTPEQMLEYVKENKLEGQLFHMEMNNYHGFHFIPVHGYIVKKNDTYYFEHAEDCVLYISEKENVTKISLGDSCPVEGGEVWGYLLFYGVDEDSGYELVFLDSSTETAEAIMKDAVDTSFLKFANIDNPRKFRYMYIQACEISKQDLISN